MGSGLTFLGRAGDPPYQPDNALHTGSGTNSKSLPLARVVSLFNFPPSFVNVGCCNAKQQMKKK